MIDEGGQRGLRLTVGSDTAVLDGAGLGELIEQLALYRAAMKPAVPETMSPKHRYHITLDPCWYAEPSPLFDATVVFFRHEGVGWSGFALKGRQCADWLDELRGAVRSIESVPDQGAKPC
ncbi:hypothetical protein [Paraburkholderia sp. J12]|uniref:hypothetical protein n=1 Tax=Paraburkholderia sp. J12 TaxID=2805432 RepID=UPI002ABD4F9F|nr:hypothetical protein [Paraburkholderia sp. J12]